MTETERLAKIEARAEKATPGPWERFSDGAEVAAPDPGNGSELIVICDFDFWGKPQPQDIENAEFVANAREDVPYLLALVQELRKERDEARAKVAMLREALLECFQYVRKLQPDLPPGGFAFRWEYLSAGDALAATADSAAWLAEQKQKAKLEGARGLHNRLLEILPSAHLADGQLDREAELYERELQEGGQNG